MSELADAWQRYLDVKDSRDRWEEHLANAEDAFADLASKHGLTWTQAVELATEGAAA